MRKPFRHLIEPLRKEVVSARHQRSYDDARCRREGLVDLFTVPDLLALLGEGRVNDYVRKDLATRGLLAEYQRSGDSFWSSLLLVAYFPMLSRLRHRIWGNCVGQDDLDQLVIIAFLGVCRDYDLDRYDSYTIVRLRQLTQKRVFKELRQVQGEQNQQRDLEQLARDIGDFDPFKESKSPPSPPEIEGMAEALFDLAEDWLPPHNIELIVATILYREPLRKYVVRVEPEEVVDHAERVYQRYKRRRTRAVKRVKRMLAQSNEPGPQRLVSALC